MGLHDILRWVFGTKEVALLVQCLLRIYKTLGLTPAPLKPGIVVQPHNPSTWEREQEYYHPLLQSKPMASCLRSVKASLKNKEYLRKLQFSKALSNHKIVKFFCSSVFLPVCGSDVWAWSVQWPPSLHHSLNVSVVFIYHVSPPLLFFHLGRVLHHGKVQGLWIALKSSPGCLVG